jgi:hypothetical protein
MRRNGRIRHEYSKLMMLQGKTWCVSVIPQKTALLPAGYLSYIPLPPYFTLLSRSLDEKELDPETRI